MNSAGIVVEFLADPNRVREGMKLVIQIQRRTAADAQHAV